ncbi:YihY/virulence factor BrkB family protein [Pelagibacterium sp. 26DY04]|uniref:YihY/virulence factor BrkB family protein n=1 Tax=Pelagibacterium sp. 26DY04 TaxID=2967130 RepID=UPI00281524A2|nr:YihY/virulence factor BrkB family protein [Pelagibacterium sp. 26DY04]WMT88795.1 YihY/virulence factor BrkB family protein [Pelagibacterium sp. 26DY04]
MDSYARRPIELKWSDWKQVLVRTGKTMIDMDTSLRCAGVAFFSFLSIFPSIAIVVLLVGLLADRSFLLDQLERLSFFMPDIAFAVIVDQLDKLLDQPPAGLGIGLAISIAIALWSGSRGVDALIYAASAAYYEKVRRSFFFAVLLSFIVTVLGAAFMITALALVAAIPILTGLSPIPGTGEQLALFLRWPVLMGLAVLAFSLLYRFTIDRRAAKARWIWPGAVLATLLWLGICLIFSLYVENFGQFEASFGSLAAAVVLLFWLYISAQIFVLGAAFNAEIELQTSIDTTIGPDKPMGSRGAYVADHVVD